MLCPSRSVTLHWVVTTRFFKLHPLLGLQAPSFNGIFQSAYSEYFCFPLERRTFYKFPRINLRKEDNCKFLLCGFFNSATKGKVVPVLN
jgi:hypothetical protein